MRHWKQGERAGQVRAVHDALCTLLRATGMCAQSILAVLAHVYKQGRRKLLIGIKKYLGILVIGRVAGDGRQDALAVLSVLPHFTRW